MRPKKPRDGALIDAMVERSRTQARLEAALGWSTHRVQTVAARYRRLRTALPKTCALWRDGTIDGYTAAKVVEAAERRHRRALADRKVCPSMEPDGMGSLWAMAGAADITAIDHRLTGLAKDLGADDSRTMDNAARTCSSTCCSAQTPVASAVHRGSGSWCRSSRSWAWTTRPASWSTGPTPSLPPSRVRSRPDLAPCSTGC